MNFFSGENALFFFFSSMGVGLQGLTEPYSINFATDIHVD